MPSSPEPLGHDATAWRLEELRPGGVAVRPASAAGPATAPLFEVARGACVPDQLLTEARAAAQAAGYAAGWANGIQAARLVADAEARAARAEREHADATRREQVQRSVRAVDEAANVLEQRAVPAAEQIEELIVEAAFAIAESLVGRALADDDVRGSAAVRRALALAPIGEEVTVRVSPADHAVLTSDGAEPVSGIANRIVYLVADPELAPGDAIATCGATTVDARLAAGLQRIRQVLGA